MDGRGFDSLTRALAGHAPRRRLLAALLGGLGLAAAGPSALADRVDRDRVGTCRALAGRQRWRCLTGECEPPGAGCTGTVYEGGVVDTVDPSCCTGVCVEEGRCAAGSSCSYSGCSDAVPCCLGLACVGTDCVPIAPAA